MKPQRLGPCVLFACCVVIAACSQTTGLSRFQPNVNTVRDRDVSPLGYSIVYSFGAPPDGNHPHAGVIGVGTTFYGTTYEGGTYACASLTCGTVFSITTGTENVLHSFGKGADGAFPYAGLIDAGGTLYGTTVFGGANTCGALTCGTVFSITTGGVEKVLHSFGKGTDGNGPDGRLIDVTGTLYGTTGGGGAYNGGTVFSITTGGIEKVLHDFGKGTDGAFPVAGLIDVSGTLYGSTSAGGAYGSGTVFSITTGGIEKVLHNFGKGTDGRYPSADLVDVTGTLYGTTREGGTYPCGSVSCGTVFSITTGGVEKVLHSFGKGTDGSNPQAPLIDVKGTLYSTTFEGGANACGGVTCGTVFSITTGGTEKVLHSFGKGADGRAPLAGLIDVKGVLFGTTGGGGAHGNGTVFSLTP